MKIEEAIDSDHHPRVVSLKGSRDGRRREVREGKGACRGVWDEGGKKVFRDMLGRMEWKEGNESLEEKRIKYWKI